MSDRIDNIKTCYAAFGWDYLANHPYNSETRLVCAMKIAAELSKRGVALQVCGRIAPGPIRGEVWFTSSVCTEAHEYDPTDPDSHAGAICAAAAEACRMMQQEET